MNEFSLYAGRRTMGISALFLVLVLVLLPQRSHAQAFSLNVTANLPGISDAAVAWGDYDSDGDLDIVLAGDSSGTRITRIYRNDGGGSFTDISAGLPGITGCAVAWGDYDRDGDLDLVLAGDTGGGFITRVYRNDTGSFTNINAGLEGVTNAAVAWGDYDSDGDLDLAVIGNSGSWQTRTIYRNNNGSFVNANLAGNYGIESGDLAWVDYDKDGDLDLAVVGNYVGYGFSMMFRNDVVALAAANWGASQVTESSTSWGDYDNDGDLDVVVIGATFGGGYVSNVFRNNMNSGFFTNMNVGLPGVAYGAVSWGDYDNDGDLDILLAGRNQSNTPVCYVYRNDSGNFTNINAGITGVGTSSAKWGDYDNDGDLDILLAGNDGSVSVTQIWVNNTTTANTPPAPPTGLTNIGNKLFWNRASDAETPQAALTYNVVVGTTSASIFTQPPMADVTTGYRRIPALGSEQHSTSAAIAGLVSGTTYYWSVQAIDAGYAGSVFATSGSFTYIAEFEQVTTAVFPGLRDAALAWGDYDSDGDLDLLLSGQVPPNSTRITRIYQNAGGTFADINAGLVNMSVGNVSWGDYDNDGDLDIAIIGQDNSSYRSIIYRNDGGSFTNINAALTPVIQGSVAWGDYDNDGDLDLLLTGRQGSDLQVTQIYRNDAGVFTDANAGLPGLWYSNATWGDYDNDGDLDMIILGLTSSSTICRIYRNDKGVFTDINAGLPGMYLGSTAWGDYDNDGDLDLLISGVISDYSSRIYRNDGGAFTNINAGLYGVYNGTVSWGDYDNDGDLDAMVSGQNSIMVYRNTGGTFAAVDVNMTGISWGQSVWGDYDNDGDLDIAVAGLILGNSAVTQLWKNNTTSANTSPLAPTGLRISSITMTGVELSWDRASDAETPQAALSYNVRIGTTATSVSVLSPMADVTTGYRRVVAFQQMTTSTIINELVPGTTYYWSVQTVDGAYAGSAFSTTGSFVFIPLISPTPTSGLPSIVTGATMWGDYDNDGDLDLLMSGNTGSEYVSGVYRNDGDGNFTDINAGLPGLSGDALAWADYDSDGDLDILIAGYSDSLSAVCNLYRNDGGVFTDINVGLGGREYHAVAWGDYDNDGDLDLLLAGYDGGAVTSLYRNDGGNFIDAAPFTFMGVMNAALAWGDYDNDGDLDILASGSNGSSFASLIYRNDDGAFTDISAGLIGVVEPAVSWGDYDSDGDLDIALSGRQYGSDELSSYIYRNDGGIFTDINAGLMGLHEGSIVWGDYNNDGRTDILLTGKDSLVNTVSIVYENTGGAFTVFPLGGLISGRTGEWGDYDNDGDLDILMTGENVGTMLWQNSLVSRSNTVPTAPTGLNIAYHTMQNIRLSWNRATDAETPQLGLSYNLIISTTTANASVQSPMADTATGYRRIVALGAEQQTTATIVNDLVPGTTYYWSVQSIDGAYAGSTFATTASFTFSPELSLMTTDSLPAVMDGATAWGDYDNDGDLDLLITGDAGASYISRIYRNDGGGNFTDINAGLAGIAKGSVSWGDYDNDGDLDIALSGNTSSNTYTSSIYRNDGGVFTNIAAGLADMGNYSVVLWGDYDSDGDLDLFLTGYDNTNYRTSIYNNDNGSFTAVAAIGNLSTGGGAYATAAWGDYDNDGDLDILLAGTDGIGSYTDIYKNDDGFFTAINANLPSAVAGSVAWGDYDNDGDLDIALSGLASISCIYRNNGGVFTNINAGLAAVQFGSVSWADYDNDGDLDLLLVGGNGVDILRYIYRNNGGVFTLVPIVNSMLGHTMPTGNWADYDNDGDLDILMTGENLGTQLWQNNTTNANTAPTPPTGLAIESGLTSVRFSWHRATDVQTPSPGLSYNLVIGTTTAGISVQSPMADMTTGYRRVVNLGNEQQTIATVVKGLIPGMTYYWSVQAVDGAYAGSAFATTGSFTFKPVMEHVTGAGLEGVAFSAAAWGDYDNDGDLDLLLAGSDQSLQNISRIYRNDGGMFIDINAGLEGAANGAVAWGDYDNDGDLDIALTGRQLPSYTMVSVIYRNDGGTFTDISADLPGVYAGATAWGDYDNDGDLDLLIGGNTSVSMVAINRIYKNDAGVFTDINAGLEGTADGTAAWGDYDNDGDLDLVLAGYNNGAYISRIYRNDGGLFTNINASLTGVAEAALAWGDYDNDGDLDLVLTGRESGSNVKSSRIYRNNNGVFTDIGAGLVGVNEGSVAWGDYDNDGDLDLALQGEQSGSPTMGIRRIYRNEGGTFMPFLPFTDKLPEVYAGAMAWGDYDNDGDLDFISAGINDASTTLAQLWRNNTTNANTAPTAPTGLEVTNINLSDVVLSWNRASDTETPQPGLSYNVVIGTTTADISVQSPMADVTTGYRRIPTLGSEYQSTRAIISGLVEGTTYYWSVQAIDGAYAGSAFATTGSFVHQPKFRPVTTNIIVPVRNSSVAWGDYDNDGDLDLLLAGNDGSAFVNRIYRNDGGNFTDVIADLPGLQDSDVAWGDYDNDGDLDIAIAGQDGGTGVIAIYRNDGGSFTDINAGLDALLQGSVAWGDYNNDGKLDLLVSGEGAGNTPLIMVYRNNAGNFYSVNLGFTGVSNGSATWGDYDNDGYLDIAFAGDYQGQGYTDVYRNEGNGNFSSVMPVSSNLSTATWGDYDNDGYPDILFTGVDESYVLRNNGWGFSFSGIFLPGVSEGSGEWGDYDNDGDLDILLTGNNGGTRITQIYRNDAGTFTYLGNGLPGVSDGHGAWGDYDNDGDLDFILTGVDNNSMPFTQIWQNTTTSANTAPIAPTGLYVASSNPAGVTLVWDPATDAETPQAGLSYNLYISTTGTISAQSPMADVTTGYRRIPAPGAEQQVNMAVMTGLTPYTAYTWSVQAIDGAYAGSVFSTSGSFYFAPVFQPVTTLPGVAYSVVAWGDYDNDGDLDILSAGFGDNVDTATVYRNDHGSGTFTNVNPGLLGVYFSDVAWGDYDNDGDLDILITGYSSAVGDGISRIYRNDNGNFTDINAGLPGVSDGQSAWGDYDNDGDLDIVMTGFSYTFWMPITKIYRNDGGNFTDINAGLIGVQESSAAWGDYDNDGDLDLLITGDEGDHPFTNRIYRNDGGNFTDIGAAFEVLEDGMTAWGDYDNDGDLDILIAGSNGVTHVSRIYRNDNGDFVDINAALTGTTEGSVAWGDYDNDGDLDIVLTGRTINGDYINRIYRNDDGDFTDVDAGLPGISESSVMWGDYDNDGDLDLFFSGIDNNSGSITQLWANTSTHANTAPVAPIGLTVSNVGGTSATFSWNPATDAQTPQAGLTYNMYIGTTATVAGKQSPMSDITTGYRRIPVMGAEQHTTSAVVTGLIPGITYYWGVQAVDGAFTGSIFATGNSVRINALPQISTTQAVVSMWEDGQYLLSVAVFDFDSDFYQLAVTVTSSNQSVLPDSVIIMQGATSATTQFLITPSANVVGGPVTITATVADRDGAVATTTFSLSVIAVNDAPEFTAGTNQTVLDDAGDQIVTNWATAINAGGGSDEVNQSMQFVVTNDNSSLFSIQPTISSTGTLMFTPAPLVQGLIDTAVVSVYAMDNGGTANGGVDTTTTRSFLIIVVSPNEAPSFVTGANLSVLDEDGQYVDSNWATVISPGSSNELYQSVEFHVSNTNNGLFTQQPSISPTGALSFTPRQGTTGTAVVTVYAADDGGTENGGVNTSATQTFTITVSLTPASKLVMSVIPAQAQSGEPVLVVVRPATLRGTWRATTATTLVELQFSNPYIHFMDGTLEAELPANVPAQMAYGVLPGLYFNSSTANITLPITVVDPSGILGSTTGVLTINHAVPSDFTITTNNAQASLSWTAPIAQNLGGYAVLRGTTASAMVEIDTSATTSYADNTAVNGVTYFYGVKSYSATFPGSTTGNFRSGMSSLVSVTVPKITVISPNGGEKWNVTTTHPITWNTISTVATVGIEYSIDNGQSWIPIISAISNTGSYDWFVPSPGSTEALVRVHDVNRPLVMDMSNSVFTIVPIAPVTGLTASALINAVQLHWNPSTSANVMGYDIYSGLTSGTLSLIGTVSSTATSFVHTNLTEPQLYYYAIKTIVGGQASAYSQQVAISPNTLRVLSPAGDEVFQPGTGTTIFWQYSGDVTSMMLEYSIDSGATWTPISQIVTSEGNKPPTLFSQEWTIPNTSTSRGLVRVVSIYPITFSDVSARFSIGSLAPPSNVVAVASSTTITVSWTASTSANVTGYRILRGTTSGNLTNLTDVGVVTSYVDTGATICTEYYYAVQTLVNVAASESSNVTRATVMLPESVTVVSPNGGESWQAGVTRSITWSSTGCTVPSLVTLSYSVNNGSSWSTIATVINSGVYSWLVPNTPTTQALVRVSSGILNDNSNAVFSIRAIPSASSLVAVAGNGYVQLNWTASSAEGLSGYRIYRGTTSGSLSLLASVASSATVYNDNSATNCRLYVYAVQSEVGAMTSAFSNEATATPQIPASLVVLSPNGGERWQVGVSRSITWVSTGCTVPSTVVLEYSTNNGGSWSTIATVSNTGLYSWMVPNTPSEMALVRISGGSLNDVSNGVFAISGISAPTSLAASAGDGSVGLSWSLSTAAGVTAQSVWRGTTSGSLSLLATLSSTATSYTDNSVTNCTLYVYAVTATVGGMNSAFSNEAAASPQIPASVVLVSPNGGEVWHGGQSRTITWTSTGCTVAANVTLSYSINNGSSWSTIATVSNTGSYSWTVPNTPSSQALVRVTGGVLSDNSNAVFTILATPVPVVTAVQPLVSTSYCAGSPSSVMVSVTLSDPIYPVSTLTVTAVSSNQSVVANANIVRQGSTSATTTFMVTPSAVSSGVAQLTISASNGYASASTTISVSVTVNPLPVAVVSGASSVCASTVRSYSVAPTTGATYRWTVSGGSVMSGQGSNSVQVNWSNSSSGSVSVIVTSASLCTSTGSMAVSINANPVVSVTPSGPTRFCPGGSVVLTASPSATGYLWSNGATTQSIVVSTGGNYSVVVSNGFGCSTLSTSVSVTVHPGVIVDAGADVTTCSGSAVQLSAIGFSPVGGLTFSWSPVTGLNNPLISNPQASPTTTTTYTVVVTDANGCSSSDVLTVFVRPSVPTTISSNAAICIGGSTQLVATGGVGYVWSPSTGLSSTTASVVTASPTTTTTYTVQIQSAGGCVLQGSVTVTVESQPVASAGSSVSVCAGGSTQLAATGGVSYSWSPSTGLSNPMIANPVASPMSTTTYTVTVSNAGGCSSSSSVTVTVNPVVLNVQVLLEGPYNGTSMSTGLDAQGLVPVNQPYNVAPFNYAGTETKTVTSGTAVVDWVLVDLRSGTASSSLVERHAGLLLSDGRIVSGNGSGLSYSSLTPGGSYYVVVWHRNHLSVMSSVSASVNSTCELPYTFMSSPAAAYMQFADGQKQLGTGVYGMAAGDANANGIINAVDRVMVRNASGVTGYRTEDVSLDGIVNAVDRVLVRNNTFGVSQVP